MSKGFKNAMALSFAAAALALAGCQSPNDQPTDNKSQQMSQNQQNQTPTDQTGTPNDQIGNGAFGERPPK